MSPVSPARAALLALALLACAIPPQSAAAQRGAGAGVIKGWVIDGTTEHRLGDATVLVIAGGTSARSDSLGRFLLQARRAGPNVVTASRLGYAARSWTIDVPAGDTAEVQLELQPVATQLDTVSVTAAAAAAVRLDGFERRRQLGMGGHFITRENVEREMPLRTSDLLRRVLGVEVSRKNLTTKILSRRGMVSASSIGQAGLCVLPIVVDGQLMEGGFDIDLIPTEDLHGIEIYSGPASVPAPYRSAAVGYCGLVMVWTRAR